MPGICSEANYRCRASVVCKIAMEKMVGENGENGVNSDFF